MAAKFQFEEQHDPSSGRSIMQQGLRSNPSSKHLWLEVYTHYTMQEYMYMYTCILILFYSIFDWS